MKGMIRSIIFILLLFLTKNIAAQDFLYAGTYSYGTHPDSGRTGILHIYPTSSTTLLFHLELNRGAPSFNSGELVGEIIIYSVGEGDFTMKKDSNSINCSMNFWFHNDSVYIRTNNRADDCGYGHGVYSHGDFKKISSETPTYFIDRSGKKIFFKDALAVVSSVDNRFLIKAGISKGDVFKPEEFQIDIGNQIIVADIYGHLSSGKIKASLDLGKEFYTRKIHFFDNDKQVIVFFEVTDDDGSFNDVYCLDKQTLKTIWKVNLWSFNLTVGQSEQSILFLGAGENAYALDIKTGKVLWQTVGLYHIHGFNYFDSIVLTDNEVQLTGKSYSKDKGEAAKTAVLNKKDGAILEVK